MFKEVLTFNDVSLVPKYNDGLSRMDPRVNSILTKECTVEIPIVNSPMDTVISLELAEVLRSYGSIPIFHRFYKNPTTMEDTIKEYGHSCFISCGAGPWGSLFKILPSPSIIREIGGFSPEFRGVGYAHGDFSRRAVAAGMVPHPLQWVDVKEARDKFHQKGDTIGGRWLVPKKEINRQLEANRAIAKRLRMSKVIHIPLEMQ